MEHLEVIDQEGNTLREEGREVIHKEGLLHKEVHVWAVTPEGEIIFQHRAPGKDTFPNTLDATAGGHVDIGETYEEAAMKELQEETGIAAKLGDLEFLGTTCARDYDPVTGSDNNPRRNVYLFKYPVQLEGLQIEAGKAVGFEAWSPIRLATLNDADAERFIPSLLNETGQSIFKKIQEYYENNHLQQ